ncbi:MAG: HEAT repeat domain-containing protein [bacterium]|nr:HEAT repeat domain-containing protein [bacterium]
MKKRFPLLILFVVFMVGFWVWFDKVSEKERPLRADVLTEIHRRIEEIDEMARKNNTPEFFTSVKSPVFQLTFIGTPAAPYLLKETLNKERNILSRMVYIQILAGIENKESVPCLIEILSNDEEDERLRAQAASALGILKDKRAIPQLKKALLGENKKIAQLAKETLKNFKE